MKKQLYMITFGVGHPCAKFIQPVMAENDLVARGIVCRYFGTQWCSCYGPDSYREMFGGGYLVAESMRYAPEEVFGTLDQEQETELYGEYWK